MQRRVSTNPIRRYNYQGDPLAEPPPADLTEILDRYLGQRDALITVLEEIQARYNYLPAKHLQYVSRELGFPLSQIFGIATFYNVFRLTAPGRHLVRVCKGTACHVNRSSAMIELLSAKLGAREDETTADGLFTLQTVACVGACSLAPVLVVDDRTYGRMTPELSWEVVSKVQEQEQLQPQVES
jgi:NADH-quinone oxidoreductase subunit E